MNESLPLHILLQQDNQHALTVLDNDYAEGLFRALHKRGYLINDVDFDDVFNASLLRIWELRGSFEDSAQVIKMLYKITKEKAIDRLRQLNTKAGRLLTGVEPDELAATDLAETIPPRELPLLQARLNIFRSAVDQLTGQQRAVIEMAILEGVPLKEVAERLGIAYTTVVTIRNRALDKMKKYLLDNHITPDMADQLSQFLTVLWLLLSTFLKNN